MRTQGTTTLSYANLMDATYGQDILFITGGIRNTGSNSMTVKITAYDSFGNSPVNHEYAVLGGGFLPFNTIENSLSIWGVLGAVPPFDRFIIDVKSTIPGLNTDYYIVATGSAQ